MGKGKKEMSHEEVWDDSALIDSWNEALKEYKKYHSIHAKGGSVRDIETADRSVQGQDAEQVDDEVEEQPTENEATKIESPVTEAQGAAVAAGSFPVQAVLGSVKDESLKKLLMSWYYAGYYTGLFEGQQQAQQVEQAPAPQ